MAQENAKQKTYLEEEYTEDFFEEDLFSKELDEYEKEIDLAIEGLSAEYELIEADKNKIGNPDSLGKVIADEIYKKFGEQLGLNATDETLIGQYDKRNIDYKDIESKARNDSKFKEAKNKAIASQKEGTLFDEYTGKKISADDCVNLDHVVPLKEISENGRFKQSGDELKDVGNIDENLAATNESLNKSKGADSNTKAAERIEKQKEALKNKAESDKAKIDNDPNMSDADKKAAKDKIDKDLDDELSAGKYDADKEKMAQKEKSANEAITKKVNKDAAKKIAGKAAQDALKQMAAAALVAMAKEIINGTVEFFKEKSKNFKALLLKIKRALANFFAQIGNFLQVGLSSFVGTIVTEIFEPIFKVFGKLISFIKQGISSFIDAIKYLTNPAHKNDPFDVKMAEVGKIVTGAIGATGTILLSTVFEGVLDSMGLGIEIPVLGTLSGIIAAFLSSLIIGVLVAIVMNLINKWLANRQKAELVNKEIALNQEIAKKLSAKRVVVETRLELTTDKVNKQINERIAATAAEMQNIFDQIDDNSQTIDDNGLVFIEDAQPSADELLKDIEDDLNKI